MRGAPAGVRSSRVEEQTLSSKPAGNTASPKRSTAIYTCICLGWLKQSVAVDALVDSDREIVKTCGSDFSAELRGDLRVLLARALDHHPLVEAGEGACRSPRLRDS